MKIRKADGRPGVAVVNDIGKVIARFFYHIDKSGMVVDNARDMAELFIKDICNGCEYLGRCEGDDHYKDYCPKNRIEVLTAPKDCTICRYFDLCLKNSGAIVCEKHAKNKTRHQSMFDKSVPHFCSDCMHFDACMEDPDSVVCAKLNTPKFIVPDKLMWAGFFWAREENEEDIPDLQGPGKYVELRE